MNTFHLDDIEKLIHNWKKEMKLSQELCSCDLRYEQAISSAVDMNWIEGIAVKLLKLSDLGIKLESLLSITNSKILVDAEYDRLDRIASQINLTDQDRNRLVFTVQARRQDAKEQLDYFQSQSMQVLLVAGHSTYLTKDEANTQASTIMAELIDTYDNICMIGGSQRLKQRIDHHFGRVIEENNWLELQGYQQMSGSMLWSYYCGSSLTKEAQSYLSRRSSEQVSRYMSADVMQLRDLGKQVFVFIDGCNLMDYVLRLAIIGSDCD